MNIKPESVIKILVSSPVHTLFQKLIERERERERQPGSNGVNFGGGRKTYMFC